MPIRDWECKGCGIRSENVPTNVPDQWCPLCGKQMEKIWSAPVIIFKGTGWTGTFGNANKTT